MPPPALLPPTTTVSRTMVVPSSDTGVFGRAFTSSWQNCVTRNPLVSLFPCLRLGTSPKSSSTGTFSMAFPLLYPINAKMTCSDRTVSLSMRSAISHALFKTFRVSSEKGKASFPSPSLRFSPFKSNSPVGSLNCKVRMAADSISDGLSKLYFCKVLAARSGLLIMPQNRISFRSVLRPMELPISCADWIPATHSLDMRSITMESWLMLDAVDLLTETDPLDTLFVVLLEGAIPTNDEA